MRYEVESAGHLFVVRDKLSGKIVKTGTYGEVEEFLDQQDRRFASKRRSLWDFWR